MAITKFAQGERKSIYDGKKLWEAWEGMGAAASHNRIREWCVANNMVNPNTGQVSRMGPYFAMWKYAFNNPDEIYPHYKKWMMENLPAIAATGFEPTFENFLRDIREHTKKSKNKGTPIASKSEYKKFCEKYNLTP